jgi:hypothetical protein
VHAFLPQTRLPSVSGANHTLNTCTLLFWEVKRSRLGRMSPAQETYKLLCGRAGIDYVCGDLTALMRWLTARGYLRADQLPHDRRA